MGRYDQKVLDWLLQGDPAIVYQVKRDLMQAGRDELAFLQSKIEREGWGKKLLQARRPDGHWGIGFYEPFTSTHYTLLQLKGLGISQTNRACRESVEMILETAIGKDGGVNYFETREDSDVCVNGMVLGVACYFQLENRLLESVVDFLMRVRMDDCGWNCKHLEGAVHSSVHTTLCVLEAWAEYQAAGYTARLPEIQAAQAAGEEFLLIHRLYQSDRTGEPMDPKMTMLSYPPRWRYDILRSLDYFRFTGRPYDPRMDDALDLLLEKRCEDGTWPLEEKHAGKVHFDMEEVGGPSRWNTLRALRVLNHFAR